MLAEIHGELAELVDDEGLVEWRLAVEVLGDQPMAAMRGAGDVLWYVGGRKRVRYCYLLGAEKVGGSSACPAPSIQSGKTLQAYLHRDNGVCHLCGWKTGTAWNQRSIWPSLDHLTPRSKGGSDYPSNIRISHVRCNKARRDRPVEYFWLRRWDRLAPALQASLREAGRV